MKLDYLNGTDYEIEQPNGMYHFNSDTELLGRFMRLKKDDTVLDVGCCTGALMLYAAYQRPAAVYGIDLFEEVTQQAKKNLALNHVEGTVETIRFQAYQPGIRFDVIVSNPPYFDTKNDDLKNIDRYTAAARHETFLSLDELFKYASLMLKEDGVFYLVHRADRLHEIMQKADLFQMAPIRMRIAYEKMNGKAKSVLFAFGFSQNVKTCIDPPVFLNERSTFADVSGAVR